MIKVIVIGACGRMGRLLVSSIAQESDMELVGAVEAAGIPLIGKDAGEVAGIGAVGVKIADNSQLSDLMKKADVAINFITPKESVLDHLRIAVENEKPMVIGTTGFSEEESKIIKDLASKTKQLHILFNNCYEDKAVINARQTRLMLD